MSFNEKVFIVTGGASGAGRGTAELLGEVGARVVIADKNAEAGERVASSIGDNGTFIDTDLRSLDSIGSLVIQAEEHFGRIDGLANVAAIHTDAAAEFLDTTPEGWQEVDDINHRAVFFLSQAVAKVMIKQGNGGAIVNVASGAAFRPIPRNSAYSGSKGAVVAMSRTMALELTEHNIRVNVCAPGHIASETIVEKLGQERMDSVAETLVGGRWMDPREVGQTIRFLLGEESRGMNGAIVNVNLGNYMPH